MITKKLLAEVLDETIIYNGELADSLISNNILTYYSNGMVEHKINVYELAHLCKEWAFEEGYSLYIKIRPDILNLKDVTHFYVVQLGFGSDKYARQFYGDSEVEAVFEACEWILNKRKDKE